MDLTSCSADWISQFVTDDYGHHAWTQLETPPFSSVFESNAAKQAKRSDPTSSWSSSAELFSGSAVISFGSSSSPSSFPHSQNDIKPKLEALAPGEEYALVAGSGDSGKRRAGGIAPVAAAVGREHVIAERKRREKLTQRFILLSSLLPGLKKLDKASVLGEAARYLKQLQEQVKTLEGQTAVVESSVVVTSSSSNDTYGSLPSGEASAPEIQARVSDKDVLINVHCQTTQGVVQKILEEIQKLHLVIVNCNAMPFGKCTMAVTVVAKMNDEFPAASPVELVTMIRQNLQTLM